MFDDNKLKIVSELLGEIADYIKLKEKEKLTNKNINFDCYKNTKDMLKNKLKENVEKVLSLHNESKYTDIRVNMCEEYILNFCDELKLYISPNDLFKINILTKYKNVVNLNNNWNIQFNEIIKKFLDELLKNK